MEHGLKLVGADNYFKLYVGVSDTRNGPRIYVWDQEGNMDDVIHPRNFQPRLDKVVQYAEEMRLQIPTRIMPMSQFEVNPRIGLGLEGIDSGEFRDLNLAEKLALRSYEGSNPVKLAA